MITYVKAIGNGKLDALGGGTINQVNSNGYQFGAYGFNSDQVLRDIQASSGLSSQSATSTVYKYAALFGRVNYRWRDEYIADLTFRRDGSSRFGPANEYHDFAAAGISWIFSQQQFFKDVFPAISLGKIKASYGTTGNDQIGDYQYLNLYSFTSAQVPYQGQVGLQPNGLTNPYLQWEETKKLQFSLDLGFFKDRILIGSNYYRNRSSNELLSYQLPIITGFTSVTKNFPATLQNSGWEFTLSTINVKTKNFDWSTHINLSIPETKLLAFPNLATSGYATQFKIGEPVTMIYVYQFKGVDPQTGLYQFSDGHGGLTPSPDTATNPTLTTRTKIINTVPRYYGGFENIIRYKGFELDFLFQFVKQLGQNYYFGNFIAGLFNGGRGNQPVYLLNRWQKVGDIASHQKFTTGYSYYQQWSDASFNSDASYTDASYIRLKNLSFSWQMPMAWRSKAHIKDLHLFVQGQNLLTFTHYQGLDPETRSSTTLPPLRVLTVGTRITL
jgi:hypothetical protein